MGLLKVPYNPIC